MLRWLALAVVLLLVAVYHEQVNQILAIIGSTPPNVFILCLVLVLLEFFLQAWRMRLVFGKEWGEILRSSAIGRFVAFSVPNRALGEMARVGAFVKTLNVPAEDAMAYAGVERLLDVIVLLGTSAYLMLSINALVGLIVGTGVLAMLLSLESERVNGTLAKLPGILGKYFRSARKIVKKRKLVAFLLVLTIALWLLDYFRVWIIVRTLGGNLGYWEVSALVALTYIVAVVSFLPGGLVVWEGGLTAGLVVGGMPVEDAIAATLLERFFSYWLWIAVGAIAAGFHRETSRRSTQSLRY